MSENGIGMVRGLEAGEDVQRPEVLRRHLALGVNGGANIELGLGGQAMCATAVDLHFQGGAACGCTIAQ
eukprot:gene11423-biopygen13931